MYQLSGGTYMEITFLNWKILLSLTYSSSGCESNWSTFGIVRQNDSGILSPSWEFSIKISTTLSILKKEKIVFKKNEWVGIRYVKLEDKRENT